MKAKFSSQKYTKGLSSSLSPVLGVQGYHPDHHKSQSLPAAGKQQQPSESTGSGALAFTALSVPTIASSWRATKLLSLQVSDQAGKSRSAFTVARDSLLDTHLTTIINSEALSTYRTETTSSTVTCTDKQN